MHRHAIKIIFALLVFISVPLAAATDLVQFTVVDRIRFSVPGDWPVIASKSTSEKTVFAFQIPNAADNGTPDSSNLSIISVDLKSDQDRDAFQKKASSTDHDAKQKHLVEGWACSSFSAVQGKTSYVIWDCYRVIANSGISVRIAWPHLPKNPPDYDKQMEAVLSTFLTNVGPFEGVPKSGVLRRPVE